MLRDQIDGALKAALKAQDSIRLATLRLMDAAVRDRDILYYDEGRREVDDQQIQSVFTKMLQQREALMRAHKESGCLELAEKEQAEIDVIREFLPYQLKEIEVEQVICEALEQTKAEKLRDIGKVMAWIKERYAGQMNFSKVCNSLRKKLQ
ncbi:GatB/YqeY domain-containing protein [Bartonella tribocorum]|uniref:Glutamyl-tRNA amidotransferase n=2 Tax=Bartonella tribocorum TaxID=85701 RepID=A0A2M6UUI5_9HYPH|nr:GatB/YqeY domain-containing protein [Bartonella tribocorum]PIT69849.1 glutamyl-tRNA amidotransferase [Bartonella tribocorum]